MAIKLTDLNGIGEERAKASKMGLVKRVPTLKDVESWVAQAKEMPRKIFY